MQWSEEGGGFSDNDTANEAKLEPQKALSLEAKGCVKVLDFMN